MKVIGITGQTGSGKTTFSNSLREMGHIVIDADLSARAVVEKGSECLRKIAEIFGDVLNADGTLNRKALANIVFNDSEKLKLLNETMYPFITEHIFDIINSYPGDSVIFLDAPTLFESGVNEKCDLIISVITQNKEEQIRRLMLRDNLTREEIEKRLQAQKSIEFFTQNSDIIINNRNFSQILNFLSSFK